MRSLLTALGIALPISSAFAYGPTLTTPAENTRCMYSNITTEQANDMHFHIPVYASATSSSPEVGWATGIIIVRTDAEPTGGFTPVELWDHRQGWIETHWVKPFVVPNDPSKHCVIYNTTKGPFAWKTE